MAVADQEIKPAVAIVIEEKCTELERQPAPCQHDLRKGEVREEHLFALTLVEAKKGARFVGKVGQQNRKAAGAVLGPVDAHGASRFALGERDAGQLADFFKGTVAFIV